MWKQTDQDLWVTITDAISWALIEQNRLNRCSLSGLLPKWGINPSTSLKCVVTDSGKLLSAGLFACQIYLVGKHLSKGLVSHLQWLLTQLCFTKSQTMSGDKVGERFEGCNEVIWNCFPYGAVSVKNKACGFWKFHLRRPLMPFNYEHINHNTFHINHDTLPFSFDV